MSADQSMIESLQREVATLRARVAELEGAVPADLAQAQRELRQFKQICEHAPYGVNVANLEGRLIYANKAWAVMTGYPDGGLGLLPQDLISTDDLGLLEPSLHQVLEQGFWIGEWNYKRQGGDSTFPGQVSAFVIADASGRPEALGGIVLDLTEQRQATLQRAAMQEDLIEAQRAALRELSTPLIPLAENVVVMPLVGTIDTARAQQIMEVLLEGIAGYQADMVLLDISGVRMVDTQVADALLRAARAVQLLGAQIILTGISADIAQTIVHLGADLASITTRANLQEGLRFAMEQSAIQ